jgi:hypothetical protein
MVSNSHSLASLIRQVAVDPNGMRTSSLSVPSFNQEPTNNLNEQAGFAGVTRNAADDNFVGSGIHLELELSSGQSVVLSIEKSLGGSSHAVRLDTQGVLNPDDAQKLKQFLTELSESVTALFSDDAAREGLFDFANMQGIQDIDLSVQQNKGNLKQRLEFEKQITQYGRKEVVGEWSRYNRLNGEQALHNFALSKQPKDVAAVYGQMDYQWVIDQVTAGMGVLGNAHTGDYSTQSQVTDFFVSAIHSLFNESRKGHELLQDLGASSQASKNLVGQTIRALSHQASSVKNMPGVAVQEGDHSASKMNGLSDFKADFASKRDVKGSVNARGEYNLTMAVSQISRSFQGANDDITNQTQFRRLLLEYDSQGEKQSYEYNWKHDEAVINRLVNGKLEKAYFKVSDLQQGILNTLNGQRNETSEYMQRKEYNAGDNDSPALQNNYIKPSTYTQQGRNVNYTV